VAEVPLTLPDTVVQDDSTGVPLLWWLGAVAVGGAVAGTNDGGSAVAPAGMTTPTAPVAVGPVNPAWGEGDPDERPSGTPPRAGSGGGGGTGSGPGTDPGTPPPPSFPPPTVVGSTPPFPFPPGGPPGGGPPGGGPPGGLPPGVFPPSGDDPPQGQPPTLVDPPTVTTTASVVPEPAPLGLLMVGGGVLALFAWSYSRRS